MTAQDRSDLLGMIVTAIITLVVLGVMAYGAMTGHDVGAFEQYGAIVIGYWFGAKAQSAVTKAVTSDNVRIPSVL